MIASCYSGMRCRPFNCVPRSLFPSAAGVHHAGLPLRPFPLGCAASDDPKKGGNQMEWATLPLKRYAEFTGRSRRKEYWMFFLLCLAAAVVLSIVEGIVGLRGMIGPYGPLT